jgi:hypothetical protein
MVSTNIQSIYIIRTRLRSLPICLIRWLLQCGIRGLSVKVNLPAVPHDAQSIIQTPRTNVGIHLPVVPPQFLCQFTSFFPSLFVLGLLVIEPGNHLLLVLIHEFLSLSKQFVARLRVLHDFVFIVGGRCVGVGPVLGTAELGGNVRVGNKGREFVHVFGEVDFGCHDGVQPASDDGPDALKDPGGFVDKHRAQRFGVVCLKAFDHELHGGVILRV